MNRSRTTGTLTRVAHCAHERGLTRPRTDLEHAASRSESAAVCQRVKDSGRLSGIGVVAVPDAVEGFGQLGRTLKPSAGKQGRASRSGARNAGIRPIDELQLFATVRGEAAADRLGDEVHTAGAQVAKQVSTVPLLRQRPPGEVPSLVAEAGQGRDGLAVPP